MNFYGAEDQEKTRKERVKKAIALAMQSRWEEAEAVNRSILSIFPQDLEAYNRLGKALSELGRNREAKAAFQRALEISPHNSIARKNLDRLLRLGDEAAPTGTRSKAAPQRFIEESGKAGLTSLINLASPGVLLKLAPGHPVQIKIDRGGLMVTDPSGGYVGQVDPKTASRLTKLIKGGNQYDATATSVGEQELTIIIREAYQDPSQAGIVSFPLRGGANIRVYMPGALLGYELAEEETPQTEPAVVKDWSDDDTEPGDDDAYTPAFHRVIHTGNEDATEATEAEEEEF